MQLALRQGLAASGKTAAPVPASKQWRIWQELDSAMPARQRVSGISCCFLCHSRLCLRPQQASVSAWLCSQARHTLAGGRLCLAGSQRTGPPACVPAFVQMCILDGNAYDVKCLEAGLERDEDLDACSLLLNNKVGQPGSLRWPLLAEATICMGRCCWLLLHLAGSAAASCQACCLCCCASHPCLTPPPYQAF